VPAASPDIAELFEAGVRHFGAGRYDEAARCFERVLDAEHAHAEAHLNLGLAYQRLGRREDASDSFLLALAARPDFAEAHFNHGVLTLEAGAHEAAARSFEAAIGCRNAYPEALSNLGYVQARYLGRPGEAERNLRRAIEIDPAFADAWCNLGLLLQDQGRFDEALAAYEEALRHDPAQQEARLNRALLWLAREDYARGWPEYEIRKRASSHFLPRGFPWPEWDGAVAPGTLLVYGEQGLGDEIMFASCIPDLVERAGRCVIECSPKLEKLFRRSFAPAAVFSGPQSAGAPAWLPLAPKIDCQVAMGSLPLHFRRTRAAFPRRSHYLQADPARIAHWKARLERLGGGRSIGISWRGGTAHTHRDRRSIGLVELLPLLRLPGVRFVSLQYTDCRDELDRFEAGHRVRIEHWDEAIADYDETAALAAALDGIVSVQTALVHLAGALGTPAWAMVPAVPEWRYLHVGEALPWYASLRVLRQSSPGDWAGVIARVTSEVAATVGR
jgi:tetratricopeptide (TPR) repeat protein